MIYIVVGLLFSVLFKNVEAQWSNEFYIKITKNNFLFYTTCIFLWFPIIALLLITNTQVIPKIDDSKEDEDE
jgi:hypothetical protein